MGDGRPFDAVCPIRPDRLPVQAQCGRLAIGRARRILTCQNICLMIKVTESERPQMTETRAEARNGQSLAQSAYNRLRKAIVTHSLAPGERVSERMLSERFSLGRAAVRDAITRLTSNGLIISRSPKKQIVAPLSMRDVRNLFDLRNLLEPDAAAKAAGNLKSSELVKLDEACQAHYEYGDAEDEFSFLEANKAFHLAVARASGNIRQAEFIEQIQDACMRIMWVSLQLENRAEIWCHGHKDIIAALVSGDANAARERALNHLVQGQREIIGILVASPTFDNVNVTMTR